MKMMKGWDKFVAGQWQHFIIKLSLFTQDDYDYKVISKITMIVKILQRWQWLKRYYKDEDDEGMG